MRINVDGLSVTAFGDSYKLTHRTDEDWYPFRLVAWGGSTVYTSLNNREAEQVADFIYEHLGEGDEE